MPTFEDPAELMSAWADAINRNQAELLRDVFAADAEFINLYGSIWQGGDAIIDGHAWALGSVLKDSTMKLEPDIACRRVGEDVTVVRAVCRRERAADASPATLEPGTTVLLMVARRDRDGWKVVAGANVAQPAPAAH